MHKEGRMGLEAAYRDAENDTQRQADSASQVASQGKAIAYSLPENASVAAGDIAGL